MGMVELVIDIAPSGACEAMYKDSFPLSFLGKAKVERASEIVHDSDTDKWAIHAAGGITGYEDVPEAIKGFELYEEARQFEVEWFHLCRRNDLEPWSSDGLKLAETLRITWE